MSQFFHESAHNKTDLKKYQEGIERVYGERPKEYCDDCGYRPSFCECNLDKEKEDASLA